MPPRFLFLTGEPATTLPLLKSRPAWSPVLSALSFDVTAGRLHRRGSPTDDFRGCIYFADVRDHDIALHNQGVLAGSAIPCWPDPAALLAVSDRHVAMARTAMDLFNLEIAGVDYVIDRGGPRFIELNPFPRVGLSQESAEIARRLFARHMDAIEAIK